MTVQMTKDQIGRMKNGRKFNGHEIEQRKLIQPGAQ